MVQAYSFARKTKSIFNFDDKGLIISIENPEPEECISSPGPGKYEKPKVETTKEKNPEWGFPKSKRPAVKGDNPGPGQYNANKTVVTSKFSIASKTVHDRMFSVRTEELPGPGAYEQKIQPTKEKAPEYSIAGKYKSHTEELPGPGQYNPNSAHSVKHSQNTGFGTQKRQVKMSESTMEGPGPGAYSYHEVTSMSTSKRQTNVQISQTVTSTRQMSTINKEHLGSPGPGMYESQSQQFLMKAKSPNFGFGTSKRKNNLTKNEENPGPGNYNLGNNNGGPSYKMGIKINSNMNSNPGPGQYDPSIQSARQRTVTTKVGTSKRTDMITSKSHVDLPGPGNYSNKDTFGTGKGFSMAGKSGHKMNENPGPGSYNYKEEYIRSKQVSQKIGTSKRTDIITKEYSERPGPGNYTIKEEWSKKGYSIGGKYKHSMNENPGPGSYNQRDVLTKTHTTSMRIGSTKRTDIVAKEFQERPGPGNYTIKEEWSKKGYSIGGKYKNQYNENPGPGSYDQKDRITKVHTTSQRIGTAKRTDIISKEYSERPGPGNYTITEEWSKKGYSIGGKYKHQYNENPGPGSYDQKDRITKVHTTSQRIGTAKRTDIITKEYSERPGPGNYTITEEWSKKGFSIGGKYKHQYNENPGPGSYDQRYKITRSHSVSQRIGSSKRTDIISKEVHDQPGPGNYSYREEFGSKTKGFQFGLKYKQKYNENPGPGSYDQKDRLTKTHTFSQRIGSAKRTDIISKEVYDKPGPGNYSYRDDFGIGMKGYKFGGKYKTAYNENPGPGQYDKKDMLTRSKTQSMMIGTSKRTQIISKDVYEKPGPGNYTYREEFGTNAKGFSIQGKYKSKYNENPGPGQYDERDSLTRFKMTSQRIGSAKRTEIVTREFMERPGPGNYSYREEFGSDAKGFKIQGKYKQKFNDNPGPGQYDERNTLTKYKMTSQRIGSAKRTDIVSKEFLERPGPGNYSYREEFGSEAKGFKIQGKYKEKYNDHPGPGQYDERDTLTKYKKTSQRIGSAKRTDIVSKEFLERPGPGNYSYREEFGSDAKGFKIQGKYKEKYNDHPGPGQYDERITLTRNKTTTQVIGSSKRTDIVSKDVYEKPGPGNYSYREEFGSDAKGFKIQGKYEERYNQNPGPGQYDERDSLTRSKATTLKIGTSKRTDIISKEVYEKPGPGNYSYNEEFGSDAKGFKIQGKYSEKYNQNPGPGYYEENDSVTRTKTATLKIGTSKRTDIVSKDVYEKPGPGNYDSMQDFGSDAKGFKIQGKYQEKYNDHPGPGQYDERDSLTRAKTTSQRIGSAKRTDIVSKEEQDKPGPGNYSYREEFGYDAKGFKIQGKYSEKYNENPGPGQYDEKDSLTRSKASTLKIGTSKRTDIVSKHELEKPGPGNYDNMYDFGYEAKSFTIAERREERHDDKPGPGWYNEKVEVTKSKTATTKIGTSKRVEIVTKESIESPGPGSYTAETHKVIGKDSTKVLIRGKQQSSDYTLSPGPGAYERNDHVVKTSTASVRIGSEERVTYFAKSVKEEETLPGPGMYYPQLPPGNAHKFDKAEKPRDHDEYPGPGHYKVPCTFADVPKYNLPDQKEEFKWV